MNITPHITITLTEREQALARTDEGVPIKLPCQTEFIIVKLEAENGKERER